MLSVYVIVSTMAYVSYLKKVFYPERELGVWNSYKWRWYEKLPFLVCLK